MSGFMAASTFNWLLRLALAQGAIIVLMLLNIVSFSLPHAGDFKPFFLLMAVYYWAVFRPTLMPLTYTFVLAVLMDLLGNMPLGLNALIITGLQILIQRSRLFLMGQPYITLWFGFALVSFFYALCLWLAATLFTMQVSPLMPLTPSLIACLLSILLFPLATVMFHALHRLLPVSGVLVRRGIRP